MTKKNVKEVTTNEEVKYEENSCFIPKELKGKMLYNKKINQTSIYYTLIKLIEDNEESDVLKKCMKNMDKSFLMDLIVLIKNKKIIY